MKNYLKKVIVMMAMTLSISGLCAVNASANDDIEIGTYNFNGTSQNSAVEGTTLIHPEMGWNRYDDSNSKIVYEGTWDCYVNTPNAYKGMIKRNIGIVGEKIKFKFYGTQVRLISWTGPGNSGVNVNIDNINYGNCSSYRSERGGSNVLFEKMSLSEGMHEIVITTLSRKSFVSNASGDNFGMDAVDTDGYLLPYDEITLNKSFLSLKKNNFEKLITSVPSDTNITWKSSDENVATVDENGKVTGIEEGEAVITASINGEEGEASCDVIVSDENISHEDSDLESSNQNKESKGNGSLYIEMMNGNINEAGNIDISDFMKWYTNRDLDKSESPFYKIVNAKGNAEYLIHDKIVSFEVR